MPDPEIVSAYQRIMRLAGGASYGGNPAFSDFDAAAQARLDAYAVKLANTLERSVFNSPKIREAVQERIEAWMASGDELTLSDLSLDLEPLLGGVRALMIARTETGAAYNGAAAYGYAAAGFTHVVWIASPFACEECIALDGQVFSIEEYAAAAIAHPNCSCGAEPEVPAEQTGEGDDEDQAFEEAA